MEKKALYVIVKALAGSCMLTVVCLLGMAALLYKCSLSESAVSIAMIALYVMAPFFAGFVAGRQLKVKKFLWGLLLGGLYFLLLVILSYGAGQGIEQPGTSVMTTCILCLAGGMLGGMIS